MLISSPSSIFNSFPNRNAVTLCFFLISFFKLLFFLFYFFLLTKNERVKWEYDFKAHYILLRSWSYENVLLYSYNWISSVAIALNWERKGNVDLEIGWNQKYSSFFHKLDADDDVAATRIIHESISGRLRLVSRETEIEDRRRTWANMEKPLI